eukprot:3940729-Rhodomonas_salina.3
MVLHDVGTMYDAVLRSGMVVGKNPDGLAGLRQGRAQPHGECCGMMHVAHVQRRSCDARYSRIAHPAICLRNACCLIS